MLPRPALASCPPSHPSQSTCPFRCHHSRWLTAEHPDPESYQHFHIRAVLAYLKSIAGKRGQPTIKGLFWE